MSFENQPGWQPPPPPPQSGPYPPGPPQPHAHGPYGQYEQYGPYGQPAPPGMTPPPYAAVMPGPVKAARVMAFVALGLTLFGCVVSAARFGPETSGAALGTNLPVIGVFVCALCFARSGPNARVTAIVFTALMILFGLGALGQQNPGGLFEFGLGIAILVTLCQRRSKEWFHRPHRR